MESFNEPLLLRVEEVAKYLGISRSKAYEMLARGELQAIHIGRSVRVPMARLKDWLERQMAEAEADSAKAN